ncbi:MAG: hypothetical protein AB9879_05110 [Methanothrix sp.]
MPWRESGRACGSMVVGQAGRASLAGGFGGGGPRAPMQPQWQEARSTGRANGRGS